MKKKAGQRQGFIVLEVLISGLILTASIAATMYLYRMGFDYLERANQSNLLSSKLIQAAGLMKNLDIQQKTGTEDLGDGVALKWGARLLGHSRPARELGGDPIPSFFDVYLYQVDFILDFKGIQRAYQINVFKYKPIHKTGEIPF